MTPPATAPGPSPGPISERVQHLEQENRRYRAVLLSFLDAFLTTDLFGTVLWASPSVERIFQWTPEELLGQNLKVLMPEPHRSRHDAYLEHYRRTGETRLLGSRRELHAVRKDGTLFPCELSVSRADIPDEPALLCGVVRDISERRADEERLSVATSLVSERNVALERSNQDLDDFARIASHDLREPLRGIRNYAAFLLEDYGDRVGTDGRSKLETLGRLAQRLESLIDDLHYYSRVDRAQLSLAPVDLQEIVEGVLESLGEYLRERGATVRLLGELPTACCERVRISEVFRNLIVNAVKYNDKPEKWVEVGMRGATAGPGKDEDAAGPLFFFVRDNGIGIPERHLDTVFLIFKRLHGHHKFGGGTGVGLAIVKKIVERHGGRIWIESTPGVGTTFCFTLEGTGSEGGGSREPAPAPYSKRLTRVPPPQE